MGAHIKDQQSYGERTNPMGTLTKDQTYGYTYKGAILWEHLQRTNSIRTLTKKQSYGSM